MSIGRSSNPAMKDSYFNEAVNDGTVMTVEGTIWKTMILLVLVVFGASFGWKYGTDLITGCVGFSQETGKAMIDPAMLSSAMAKMQSITFIGGMVAFVFAVITCFVPTISPYTSIVYSLAEGVSLGALSYSFNILYSGIAINALMITLAIAFTMLALYRFGIIKCTETFKSVVTIGTVGACLASLGILLIRLFSPFKLSIFDMGPVAIGICIVFCFIAAFNYILDFETAVKGAEAGAPKYMEWYAAFGIMVTTVWLYVEVLRLLSYLNKKN